MVHINEICSIEEHNETKIDQMKLLVSLLTLLLSSGVHSQIYEWAHSTGSIESDEARNISIDVFGDVLLVGDYGGVLGGSVDLDPGPGAVNYTTNGNDDVFIQKFSPDGTLIWGKAFGGTLDDGGYCITSDDIGNVYVSGFFQETVDFDPGPGVSTLISNGLSDIFILKLSINGDFIWVKQIGGAVTEKVKSIEVDESNDLVLVGAFYSTLDFDPGPGTDLKTSNGGQDIFVQKLDTSGTHLWVETFGGGGQDKVESVFVGNDLTIYMTGSFQGTVDFNPGAGVDNHTVNGMVDYFLLKLDSNGVHQWANTFGGSENDDCFSVFVDTDSNVYLTGFYCSTVDFDPGPGVVNHTCNGWKDIFVHKLTSDGDLIWVRTFGGISEDSGSSVRCDQDGNVYIGLNFNQTVDFNPLGGGNIISSFGGSPDFGILKLDSSGNSLWVQAFGGQTYELVHSIAVANDFSIYACGVYSGTPDFDPGPGVDSLTENGSFDSYLVKIRQCLAIDNTVSQLDALTLESNNSGGTYSWVDCNNGYSAISGETSQSFTAVANGSYAVIVTEENCSDTSACFIIDEVGLSSLDGSPHKLIKIMDMMGRETRDKPNTLLIYVYDDGTTEKVFRAIH
jgi:hypothetical protein